MNIIKLILINLAIIFGAILFILAEFDDSPGGQLISLMLGIAGGFGIISMIKNK